ncbi:hypothetical protein scyTo_0022558, partial [Scyliorhinus torazame]|nr:hypothetical protein [Scyliorhinus torazame]
DGDPHFVIRIPHSNETICFTVDGQADDTLRLVEDSVSGQFQHADIRLQRPSLAARRQGPDQAELWFGSHKLAVSLVTKTLKDSHLPAHEAACWLVHREDVEPLMGGPYLDYVVPRNRSA